MKKMAKFTPPLFLMLLLLEVGLLSMKESPVTAVVAAFVGFCMFLTGIMLMMGLCCCFFQVVHRALQKHDGNVLRNMFFQWISFGIIIFALNNLLKLGLGGVPNCLLDGLGCMFLAQAYANAWRKDENDR